MTRDASEEGLLRTTSLQNEQGTPEGSRRAEPELSQTDTARSRGNAALELHARDLAVSLSTLRATLESTSEAILVTSSAGLIVDFNDKLIQLFGLPREALLGLEERRLWSTVIRLDSAAEGHDARAGGIDRVTTEIADQLTLADGRVILRNSAAQVVDDRVVGRVWSLRDITQLQRREEALRIHADALAEADRKKNEFLAMLSHELRNPLAAMSSAMKVIQGRGCDPEARERAHATLERQTLNMTRMVDDLLDVSRIENGRIQIKREIVDLVPIVRNVVEDTRCQAIGRKHSIHLSAPASPVLASADAARFGQVVGNLIGNALKFTRAGGNVWISLETDAPLSKEAGTSSATRIVLRVRDDGAGIAADQLERIFGLFVRVDETIGRTTEGLGLGLALARVLIELHEGTIDVRSPGLGFGTEFTVRLASVSRGTVKAIHPPQVKEDMPPARSRKILVVDDNVDAAEMLAILLRMRGYEVHMVHDGPTAIDRAARDEPDVVLLDLGMPGMNGYEIGARLRSQDGSRNCVLVAITGYAQSEHRELTRKAGFDHHLAKPVDFKLLESVLSAATTR